MANRHLSRSVVLQTLFEWDFTDASHDIDESLDRNMEEFAPGVADEEFTKTLVHGVIEKQKDIDSIIEKAAPDWPLTKIANVDRNILRLGLFELLFADRTQVPAKVAINEAVELAKTFGGENSGKFVNGVLGAVYKEIGEPGKDDIAPKRKERPPEVPYEEMPIEKLGGAIVYSYEGDDLYFGFVHDIFGHWTLSKGHLEEGLGEEDGTVAKIKEEIGIDITIEEKLSENEYIATHPEKGKIRKQVSYFLAKSDHVPLQLAEDKQGLDNAKWFKAEEITDLNFYDDILPIVTKAVEILHKQK